MPCPFYLLNLSNPSPHFISVVTISFHAPTLSHLNHPIPPELAPSNPPLSLLQVIPTKQSKWSCNKQISTCPFLPLSPSGLSHTPRMRTNSPLWPSRLCLSWPLATSSAPSYPTIHLALWVSVTLAFLICLEGSWHSPATQLVLMLEYLTFQFPHIPRILREVMPDTSG